MTRRYAVAVVPVTAYFDPLAVTHLEALAGTGLYGATASEVVTHMALCGLERALEVGALKIPPEPVADANKPDLDLGIIERFQP